MGAERVIKGCSARDLSKEGGILFKDLISNLTIDTLMVLAGVLVEMQ